MDAQEVPRAQLSRVTRDARLTRETRRVNAPYSPRIDFKRKVTHCRHWVSASQPRSRIITHRQIVYCREGAGEPIITVCVSRCRAGRVISARRHRSRSPVVPCECAAHPPDSPADARDELRLGSAPPSPRASRFPPPRRPPRPGSPALDDPREAPQSARRLLLGIAVAVSARSEARARGWGGRPTGATQLGYEPLEPLRDVHGVVTFAFFAPGEVSCKSKRGVPRAGPRT